MEQESTIEQTVSYYHTNKENHLKILKQLKKRIYHIGTLRLLIITGMLVALWILRDNEWRVLAVISVVCLFCFLLLVVYHAKLHHKRAFEEGLIRLFENELKAMDNDFSAFDGAPEHIDAQHAFSMDLDIFGDRSLFQMINRTVTQMGKDRLVNHFKQPLSDKKNILIVQESIQELVAKSSFRHHFYVTGKIALKEKQDLNFLFSTDNLHQITGNRIINSLIWLVPACWILLIAGSILHWIPASYPFIYCAVSYLLVHLPLRRIRTVFASVEKTEIILQTYSKLLEQVEQEHFNAFLLQKYQRTITGEPASHVSDQVDKKMMREEAERQPVQKTSASYAIKSLSRTIGALDQRTSFMGVLLNLLYMRDTRQAMKLERWKQKYACHIKTWFDTLGVFDTFCSYGTFAFNHPDYTYPTLTEAYFEMEGKALGHPLIHRDKCVRNDIHISKNNYFMIVTGANMAGKSTFLRTIGVNFLFTCMGLPVCAASLAVYPAQLVTSLRTADSLVSNESYFFAELKRLQMIINRLEAGEQLVIILDEILKGTNSVDKQKGSLALIKQLIHKNTYGIIATHDLSLGALSDIFPDNIQNKRFEAEIAGDEISFTYQLRDGIAQNMNATILMKKMGIFEKE